MSRAWVTRWWPPASRSGGAKPSPVPEAIDERHNLFLAIAERSLAIGYEALIGAVTITPEAAP
jgi:hypothetical protein